MIFYETKKYEFPVLKNFTTNCYSYPWGCKDKSGDKAKDLQPKSLTIL